jgi:phosphoribosylamine---glycine ligase
MNIALIGSGGREHALCKKLIESSKINRIFCIPGNAGTSKIAKNLNFDFLNFGLLLKNLRKYKVNLVIVGPEQPLVNGVVDFLRKKKIKVFGPSKYASKLEGSKSFMKSICKQNKIPTANFKICNTNKDVLKFLKNNKFPVVVKADGLAAGKGVVICKSKNEVIKISKEIFAGKFKSSRRLVLEEFLVGEEASYFVLVDKYDFTFFGSAQDHKRVGEKEKGPNTGGMGAYSPAPIITPLIEKKIIDKIIKPTLLALKKKKEYFSGFLYAGIMIKNNEPYLIEYNVRMGDPECQVILPRLKSKLFDLIKSAVENKLRKTKVRWYKKKCMTIVLCSKGYPGQYVKGIKINKIDKIQLPKDSAIFHAGTSFSNGNLVTTGGRVLNITKSGNSFLEIRKDILKIIKKIIWKKCFFRKDIGWRVI